MVFTSDEEWMKNYKTHKQMTVYRPKGKMSEFIYLKYVTICMYVLLILNIYNLFSVLTKLQST